jgi:hypothetical protein
MTEEGQYDDDYMDDDGSFEGYVETTTDPGPVFLIAVSLFAVFLYCLLPCVVSYCNRRDRRKKARQGEEDAADADEIPFRQVSRNLQL